MTRDTARAMSEENVEIVRAFFEEALLDPENGGNKYLAEDVEYVPFSRMASPSRGPAGFLDQIADIADQFEIYEVQAERLEEVGGRVVADLRRRAKSKRGPVEVTDRFAEIFTLHDGRIVRIQALPTVEEARKVARLRE
jgi:ketosteroid isomerase-like protein